MVVDLEINPIIVFALPSTNRQCDDLSIKGSCARFPVMQSKIAQLTSAITLLKNQQSQQLKSEREIKALISVQEEELLLMDNIIATLAKQIAIEHVLKLEIYVECIRFLFIEPEIKQKEHKKQEKSKIFKKFKQMLSKFTFCTK